jgi:hypothetical protein
MLNITLLHSNLMWTRESSAQPPYLQGNINTTPSSSPLITPHMDPPRVMRSILAAHVPRSITFYYVLAWKDQRSSSLAVVKYP